MDTVIERCGGLDVHKDTVVACVRVPGPDGRRDQVVQTFGTTTTELLTLRDWLPPPRRAPGGAGTARGLLEPPFFVPPGALPCWRLEARPLPDVLCRENDAAGRPPDG